MDSHLHCDQNFMQSSHNPVTMHIWEVQRCREGEGKNLMLTLHFALTTGDAVTDAFRAGVADRSWK